MPKPTTPPTETVLCAQRARLLSDIATLQAAVGQVDEKLIALGAGRYQDETGEHCFTVVAGTEEKPGKVTYELTGDFVEQARVIAAGDFKILFDRAEVFIPCASFEDVVPKVLKKSLATKLLELCRKVGKPTAAKAAFVRAS